MRPTCAVILAAGEGTRMRSDRPKPLHRLCGRPMTGYVIEAAGPLADAGVVVVVGHGAVWVEKELAESTTQALTFVEQDERLGTGHAVSVALGAVRELLGTEDGDVLILPGDTPLLRGSTLERLLEEHRASQAALTVLSARLEDPTGYGRILRGRDGNLERIVEERDAQPEERAVSEVNTAVMVVRADLLGPALRRLGRHNAQNEYYLTDLVEELRRAGHPVRAHEAADAAETLGVNDRAQLAAVEAAWRQRLAERWMLRGVTLWDPATTYLDATVVLEPDVTILPGTMLRGSTRVGAGAVIGPHAELVDCQVGRRARVAQVVARSATVGEDAVVGPFCVLRPGGEVGAGEVLGAHQVVGP